MHGDCCLALLFVTAIAVKPPSRRGIGREGHVAQRRSSELSPLLHKAPGALCIPVSLRDEEYRLVPGSLLGHPGVPGNRRRLLWRVFPHLALTLRPRAVSTADHRGYPVDGVPDPLDAPRGPRMAPAAPALLTALLSWPSGCPHRRQLPVCSRPRGRAGGGAEQPPVWRTPQRAPAPTQHALRLPGLQTAAPAAPAAASPSATVTGLPGLPSPEHGFAGTLNI